VSSSRNTLVAPCVLNFRLPASDIQLKLVL
jgi:hypothetical protein